MRITIKTRLFAAFGFIILLMGGMVALGISALGTLNTTLEAVLDGPTVRLERSLNLRGEVLQLEMAEKNLILTGADRTAAERAGAEMLQQRQALTSAMEAGIAAASEQGRPRWVAVREALQQYIQVQDRIREAVQAGNLAEATTLSITAGSQAIAVTLNRLSEVVAFNEGLKRQARTEAAEAYDAARTQLLLIAAVVLLIALGAAAWIAMSISRGLSQAVGLAHAVALGDLTQTAKISSNDEVRDVVEALDRMTANLRQTATVAEQIAAGNLTVETRRLSDRDTMGIALEMMLEKLRGVVSDAMAAAQNVAAGSEQLSASAEQMAQPALPWPQVPGFMAALRERQGQAALALQFAILTAARTGEVRGMTWGEIDMEARVWTVPAARMKAGEIHRVPLSDAAMKVLAQVRPEKPKATDIIFANTRGSALSDMALTMLVRGMALDGLEEGKPPRWRDVAGRAVVPHGFRSSFRDWAGETRPEGREVAERALAHLVRGVEGAYARWRTAGWRRLGPFAAELREQFEALLRLQLVSGHRCEDALGTGREGLDLVADGVHGHLAQPLAHQAGVADGGERRRVLLREGQRVLTDHANGREADADGAFAVVAVPQQEIALHPLAPLDLHVIPQTHLHPHRLTIAQRAGRLVAGPIALDQRIKEGEGLCVLKDVIPRRHDAERHGLGFTAHRSAHDGEAVPVPLPVLFRALRRLKAHGPGQVARAEELGRRGGCRDLFAKPVPGRLPDIDHRVLEQIMRHRASP